MKTPKTGEHKFRICCNFHPQPTPFSHKRLLPAFPVIEFSQESNHSFYWRWPQDGCCCLEMSLLPLPLLDFPCSAPGHSPRSPPVSHLRATLPAVLMPIRACAWQGTCRCVFLMPWGLHEDGPVRQLSGQSLCHSAELHIYWFESNGGKTASQAGNGVYSNGLHLEGAEAFLGAAVECPFPGLCHREPTLLCWVQGPMFFKGKMVVHAPLWEILTIHITVNILWACYVSFSRAIPHE